MDQELAESPRQFVDGLKSTIFRRRIGQIALAVVLAEACIRFLNAFVWFFVIPVISNALKGHTESVLFKEQRIFPWEQLAGQLIDFAVALAFVYFANRWIMNLSRQRIAESEAPPMDLKEEGPAAAENQQKDSEFVK
jgi:large-conductance mechanosensitive channel